MKKLGKCFLSLSLCSIKVRGEGRETHFKHLHGDRLQAAPPKVFASYDDESTAPEFETIKRAVDLRYSSTPHLNHSRHRFRSPSTGSRTPLTKRSCLTCIVRAAKKYAFFLRDPNRPISSLPGPPVPPRRNSGHSHHNSAWQHHERRPSTPCAHYSSAAAREARLQLQRERANDATAANAAGAQSAMRLRRSTSETKVDKNKRNEERAGKAKSVHFDGRRGRDNILTDR